MGFIGSLNIGLNFAKGKYIACCNQDDLSFPKRFEIQFNYLEKNPHIFLIGTSAIYINEHGKEIRRFRKYDNYKIVAWRLRKSCSIIHPSTMFRNKDVYFDDHFEYNLYYRLLKRGENMTNLPEFLIKFRVHKDSMSTYDKKRQERLRDEVIARFKELDNRVGFLNKIGYSIKLFLHHIKTRNEKKIAPLR
jgi:glycosyltransferase involved in cell wall biosynthesis